MTEESVEYPVLDLLKSLTADSLDASDLDPGTLMLVRIAALVAIDAPPASYLLNLGVASELGIGAEDILEHAELETELEKEGAVA